MPPTQTHTQPSNPNTIDIYRNMKFTYDQGLVNTTIDCKCPCETDDNVNNCAPVEKLFLYGVRPSPVKELYNYFKDEKFKQEDGYTVTEADGTREFPDDSWSKSTANDILNINQQGKILDESGFERWQKIMNRYTSACVICEKIKSIVESHRIDIEQTLAGLNEAYNSKRTAYSTDLDKLIANINEKKTQFEANQETIRQQKKKIRLAHKLLNAQADKLKTFGQQFTSLQTQYKERHLDRVSFGLPYLKPIYTMSSRQFFVLMVVLNIVLVVVIGVYGFYPRNQKQKSEANRAKEWACVTDIFFLVWPIIEFPHWLCILLTKDFKPNVQPILMTM